MQSHTEVSRAEAAPGGPAGLVAPWVGIALRALDTTLATSQNLIEGADRLARAGASPELPAPTRPLSPVVWSGTKAALACGMAMAGALQRSTVGLFAQAWRQWAAAVDEMGSIATRGQAGAHPNAAAWPPRIEPHASRPAAAAAREPREPRGEHAAASSGTKRRRPRAKAARRAR